MPLSLTRRLWAFCARILNRPRDEPEPLALPAPAAFAPALDPADCLDIPIRVEGTDEETRQQVLNHGRFLARQDRWDDLAGDIRRAERDRAVTPGGMPRADLLALGARTDVVLAAEHALADGAPPDVSPLTEGIAALEEVLADNPGDYAVGLVVALAHVDLGWAWRGGGWDATVPRPNRERFRHHFDRARQILDPYCGIELSSPAIAAARCALLVADPDPRARITDDYEDLIDLDPRNHRHLRTLGTHLLPRWYGGYDRLDLEARRTAARTRDVWGAGGYAWVSFDAIATDEEACARVDVDFFVDGLRDIVAARPDQYMINVLTAYCAVTMQQRTGYDAGADYARSRIADCTDWLIRDHLTEVHPLIWANAVEGADASTRITSLRRFLARGQSDALNAICDHFADDILRGNRIRFTPQGPQLQQA